MDDGKLQNVAFLPTLLLCGFDVHNGLLRWLIIKSAASQPCCLLPTCRIIFNAIFGVAWQVGESSCDFKDPQIFNIVGS